jgi:alpha-ketoglutarate-dependent 2,4-dichlorophenoxyacetate dioxygenase
MLVGADPLRITPLHPHIGAKAEGVDLRQPLTPELAASIEAAMDQHAVLVFPGQDLSDQQHMAFGTSFGPVEHTRATVDQHRHRLQIPEMNDISKLAVIATIRTMLNYFLAKDIAEFDQARESAGNPPAA